MLRVCLVCAALAAIVVGSTGCTAAVVGAAAAGGYLAHENGYRVRNPITHSGGQASENASE
jgi:hypothetical protein